MRLSFVPAALLLAVLPAAAENLDPVRLGEAWTHERFVETSAPCLRPAELESHLRELSRRHPELRLDEVGRSVQQRPIYRMMLGSGEQTVLLWSQMHGDEPSATPALLDLAHYLLSHRQEPAVTRLLERLTLVMVPMLNPDGAEIYSRRNAQGIDINRDALNLATPEGRLLKKLREEHQPRLGFNLHDQNRRRTVGNSPVLAANAVLAVVGDEAKTLTPGRVLAKRAAVAIAAALETFVPGGIARFDDTFSPRSFGDNLTAWGTPVVLIESGGLPPGVPLEELTRLNFVALLTTLDELAASDLAGRDPELYDQIPENNVDVYADVAIRGSRIQQPGAPEPYRADVVFDQKRGDRELSGCQPPGPPRSEIAELGDARIFAAGREIAGAGQLLFPTFVVGAEGMGARRFLDEDGLERLAQLGVSRVRWVVAGSDFAAARELAARLQGPRRPSIEVSTDRRSLPPVRLQRRPDKPRSARLGDHLAALVAAAKKAPANDVQTLLAALWDGTQLIRYEGPATFQMARTARDLEESSVVTAVYLDGVVAAGARP